MALSSTVKFMSTSSLFLHRVHVIQVTVFLANSCRISKNSRNYIAVPYLLFITYMKLNFIQVMYLSYYVRI